MNIAEYTAEMSDNNDIKITSRECKIASENEPIRREKESTRLKGQQTAATAKLWQVLNCAITVRKPADPQTTVSLMQ